jgi:hypothetical protein
VRRQPLHGEEGTPGVDRELSVVAVLGHLLDRRELRRAGEDEQRVERSSCLHVSRERVDVGEAAHVRPEDGNRTAEFGARLLHPSGIAAGDEHGGATLGQPLRGRRPHAVGPADHERRRALQLRR